jgi:hypothetical protein
MPNNLTDISTSLHDLWNHNQVDYAHLQIQGTTKTQVNMKRGIDLFGNTSIEAVQKELWQLQNCKVLAPRNAHNLSSEEKGGSTLLNVFEAKIQWANQGSRLC